MARKSRKETAAVVVQEADATFRAAIYVRLSVEDRCEWRYQCSDGWEYSNRSCQSLPH